MAARYCRTERGRTLLPLVAHERAWAPVRSGSRRSGCSSRCR
ncbi:hypothetical protein [Ornithinimicrobium kibberense]